MKFKKGWIFEEIEKKNKKDECLDDCSKCNDPEEIEKEREKKEKEMNKRFSGTKKNAEKTVGDDFEDHAKPHKVEEHFKTRKELAEATKDLKDNNIDYKINRSTKDGFRYVLEYYCVGPKKKEIFEKLELDEDAIDDVQRFLAKKLLPPKKKPKKYYEIYWYEGEDEDGDVIGDPIFKTFSTKAAAQKWYDEHKKDKDKFQMDSPSEQYDESLNEGVTFEVNDDGDLVAKSKDNFLIIGSDEDKDLPDEEKKKRMMKVLDDFKNDDTMKSEYDYWMSVLKENFVDEVLPDAIPEEPIVVSTEPEAEIPAEPVSDEIIETGIYSSISSELRDTLADIENLKSLVVTLSDEGRDDFIEDLNSIIDDRTIHTGILQKLMAAVDSKVEAEETNTVQDKEEMMDAELVEPTDDVEESLEEARGPKEVDWYGEHGIDEDRYEKHLYKIQHAKTDRALMNYGFKVDSDYELDKLTKEEYEKLKKEISKKMDELL